MLARKSLRPLAAHPPRSPSAQNEKMTVLEALGDTSQQLNDDISRPSRYECELLRRAARMCQLTSSKYDYSKYL
jgi:hypothetical protein